MNPAAICLSTFLASLGGSFLPVGGTEMIVLSAGALLPPHLLLPLALSAAVGQMFAKSVVYFAGRGLLRLPRGRFADRLQDVLARAQRWQNTSSLCLLGSASLGLPPFYLVSIAAGTLRVPFARFFAIGLCGRVLRFVVLVGLPHALKSAL